MHELAGFPPKVFIIGAQKAGTTQLSELLDQHPDICLSNPKEPDFFSRHYKHGLDWYKERFSDPDKVLIDASTSYTSRPLPELYPGDSEAPDNPLVGIPERMASVSPDAKLIYILRDPVKRAYSGYWHQVRAGHESASISTAFENNSYYKRVSNYSQQLSFYLPHYNSDNILILDFDALISSPEETVRACLTFLGLSPIAELHTGLHKNKSFQYPGPLNKINQMLSGVGGLNRIIKRIRRFIPAKLTDALKGSMTKPVPPISEEDIKSLSAYFDDEIAKARSLLAEENCREGND